MSFFGDMINRTISFITLLILKILTRPLKTSVIEVQYAHNDDLWKKDKKHTFIDNQNSLKQYKYGVAGGLSQKLLFSGREMNAADNICEVVAVYNSLNCIENHIELPIIIKEFSEDGIVLNGVFGTNPCSIKKYFVRHGFSVCELRGEKICSENIKKLSEEYEAYIISTFNKGWNPFSGIHTMCIEKCNNKFIIHNDYEGNKCYCSLYDAITGYNKGCSMTFYAVGIRTKN